MKRKREWRKDRTKSMTIEELKNRKGINKKVK